MSVFKTTLRAVVVAVAVANLAFAKGIVSPIIYVRCGKLMTAADEPLRGPIAMLVADGKVIEISSSLPMPVGAQLLDLSRYTVMPAFIDSHIHLWTGPYTPGTTPSAGLQVLRAQKAMEYALRLGVAGVRVLGASDFLDVALHDAIEEGTIIGPHVLAAGYPITVPGGHADQFTFPATLPLEGYYTPLHGYVNSPADAEKAVHLQIKYGAKTIKMFASGGVGSPLDSPDAEQLSPEEMREIVTQAHMDHLKVAAHDESLQAILDALHAGVDSLEHASELNTEAIGYMKAHQVWWDPTLYIIDTMVTGEEASPEYEIRKGKMLAAKHFASFRLGMKSGLAPRLVAGSDMKYEPDGGSVLDEVIALVKHGATPTQALIAATKNGAALAGWDDMGTLGVGKEADFVAIDGDPTEDISAVKKTECVVFKGRVVTCPAL